MHTPRYPAFYAVRKIVHDHVLPDGTFSDGKTGAVETRPGFRLGCTEDGRQAFVLLSTGLQSDGTVEVFTMHLTDGEVDQIRDAISRNDSIDIRRAGTPV